MPVLRSRSRRIVFNAHLPRPGYLVPMGGPWPKLVALVSPPVLSLTGTADATTFTVTNVADGTTACTRTLAFTIVR